MISLILETNYNIGHQEYILRRYSSVLSINIFATMSIECIFITTQNALTLIRNSKWRKNNILDAIEYVQYDISK